LNTEDKERIRAEVNQAIDLWHAGSLDFALEILLRLADEQPSYPTLHGLLGAVYRSKGDHKSAVGSFRRAVQLSPRKELPSLGLFHSLYALGRKNEAVIEMKRFLSVSKSEEYNRLIVEMNTGGLDDALVNAPEKSDLN
jgi:predicted Zn-dependent protease